MKEIKVFAPATVANVACGFDVLGFAVDRPGDEVIARLSYKHGVKITKITGDGGKLPLNTEKNTASIAVKTMLNLLNSNQGIELEINKQMPLGSGMGSSAASSVAAVFAVNELLGKPMTKEQMLPFTMEGERIACGTPHADNVAPALFGGFVLIRSYDPLDVIPIKTPKNLVATVVHPHIEITTADARAALKSEIPLTKAIKQWGNTAALIAGLLNENYNLISRSLEDVIIEPARAHLIPGFYEVKKSALEAGALGCSISGAGPSIFALSTDVEKGVKIGEVMKNSFMEFANLESDIFVSKVNQKGPVII